MWLLRDPDFRMDHIVKTRIVKAGTLEARIVNLTWWFWWKLAVGEKEVSLQEIRSEFEFVPDLFGIVLRGGYLYGAWPRTVIIIIEFEFIVPELWQFVVFLTCRILPEGLKFVENFSLRKESIFDLIARMESLCGFWEIPILCVLCVCERERECVCVYVCVCVRDCLCLTCVSLSVDGMWLLKDYSAHSVMVLQCALLCCSVLQCVAVCCSVL